MSNFVSLSDYKIKIDSAIINIKNEYFYIGFLLNEIKHHCSVDFSITDWCYENFGFKKSFTYQLMNVAKLISDNGKMCISKSYEGYNFSQLSELLSVPEHLRYQFDSSMSVREIREHKKYLSGNKSNHRKALQMSGKIKSITSSELLSYIIDNVDLFKDIYCSECTFDKHFCEDCRINHIKYIVYDNDFFLNSFENKLNIK